ncbi:hypothetical protein [Candidatus Sulfurimonas baltica]|uniref:Uncharacterized protein n=1 Tax=Candidatus Sulfurimonas baltica TaxID=2740404 RepID=A0A7S7RLY9_9BACT|nr:hypothetical protein [Candidatus Sulfurimonas baltica]QOY50951.1 hypothetical protein HUE88_07280 [Candidatus Sulfurimonas baltica]
MPTNTPEFKIKKIKGDFAELICKHHFELMGCHVNKVGIEELSPAFAKLQSGRKAVASLKNRMQYMPDFLVVHPSGDNASFVEVKYRANISDDDLVKYSKEWHEQYADFIKDSTPVYFYLLTNKEPYVHIMKANALKHFEQTGGFYYAGIQNLNKLPFFSGTNEYSGFNAVYSQSIRSAIFELYNGQ